MLNNVINRFLCHTICISLKVVMLLFGIGSIAYLCANMYYIFYQSGISNKIPLEIEEDIEKSTDNLHKFSLKEDIQTVQILNRAITMFVWAWVNYSKSSNIKMIFFIFFQPKKVNVTVFYEVLCPDSRHFILRQLYPTWNKVSELMEIDYRPFGKATVSIVILM